MAFVHKLLEPGEQIRDYAAAYWLPQIVRLVCFGILAAASLVPVYRAATGQTNGTLSPLAIGFFTIFPLVCVPIFCVHIGMLTTRRAITNRRFIATRFVPFPMVVEVRRQQIAGVELRINSSGKTFGYGTVVVLFTDHTWRKFNYIRSPQHFAESLAEVAQLDKQSSPPPPGD